MYKPTLAELEAMKTEYNTITTILSALKNWEW